MATQSNGDKQPHTHTKKYNEHVQTFAQISVNVCQSGERVGVTILTRSSEERKRKNVGLRFVVIPQWFGRRAKSWVSDIQIIKSPSPPDQRQLC